MLDPFTESIVSLYKEKVGKYTTRFGFIVGLVGGTFFLSAVFEHLLGYQTKEAFLYGFICYLGLFLVLALFYCGTITFNLFRNPQQLRKHLTESEHLLNEWMSELYGVERIKMKEKTKINSDGSFESVIELVVKAIVEGIHAFEIHAMYLGPLQNTEVVVDEEGMFAVTPQEFGPIKRDRVKFANGWYKIEFPKDLPTDSPVTIEYKEWGKANIFATSPDKYPQGIHFDYIERQIFYPTRLLTIEVCFDGGYPLSTLPERLRAVVWYGNAKVEHSYETARAQHFFNFDLENRQATLKILFPLLGLQYAIRWVVQ